MATAVKARAASVGARSELPSVAGWRQFALLAALTAFTGSIVGLERAILPLIGAREFGLASYSAILGFIVSFGVAKALANLTAGRMADALGRRRVLMAGWGLGLVEPVLIVFAQSWEWIVAANVLLGVQQGLCWTTLLAMMIDRARRQNRGFAAGVNEFSGYTGVALSAFASGYLAAQFGLRPVPFFPGFAFAAIGLALTALFVTETARSGERFRVSIRDAVALPLSVLRNRLLLAWSQAGLATNFLDAMLWGLLPMHFARRGLAVAEIAVIAGAYPLAWGLAQFVSGPLSDRVGRRAPIVVGMAAQGIATATFLFVDGLASWLAVAIVLGLCRALTYPTLLAAAADAVTSERRASGLGVYRFYRDSGFVLGGVLGGLIADLAGIPAAVASAALLILVSGGVAFVLGAAPAATLAATEPIERPA